jgi:MazG family protein
LSLGQALEDLQQLTVRLRRECPWDREQTASTIVPHTVEEAYEVADAALSGDDAKLVDELGDLLYQTFFLSLLLSERGSGGLEQVSRGVHDKLVRRHPHVFGGSPEPDSAGAVKHRWEELKTEQEGRRGVFHDLPESLPSLLYARKVQRRVATAGFDYPDLQAPLAHLEQELHELRAAIAEAGAPAAETEPDVRIADELGDVLFTLVGVAAKLNVDPELALRQTTQKFVSRVELAAERAAKRGENWTKLGLDAQLRYYDEAKEALR